MGDEGYRRDLEGRAREPYRRSNPKVFEHMQRNPEVAEKLAAVERRAADITERLRAHCQRNEERWTSREAVRLWKKRAVLAARHPAPAGALNMELSSESLGADARRNVRARATRRISEVSRIKTSMEDAAVGRQRELARDHAPRLAREFEDKRKMRISL